GGGEGILPYTQMVKSLANTIREPLQICAVTGTNTQAYRRLIQLQEVLPKNITLVVKKKLPASELSQWVRSADLYIPKAGANSPAEAFVANIPTIVADVLRGHESDNARFMEDAGLALVNRDPKNIGTEAARVLKDADLRRDMREAQLDFRNSVDPKTISRFA